MRELTDREKVILLATKIMGWPNFGKNISDNSPIWNCWNPLESISAAMEMQAKIPEAMRRNYLSGLISQFSPEKTGEDIWQTAWDIGNATARQRSDAAIAVLEAQCR